jgi:hypothetical protein
VRALFNGKYSTTYVYLTRSDEMGRNSPDVMFFDDVAPSVDREQEVRMTPCFFSVSSFILFKIKNGECRRDKRNFAKSVK